MPYYEENETYILTAILDLRFKLRWCSNDAEKQKSIDLLKSVLERIIPQSHSANAATQVSEEVEPLPKNGKHSLILWNQILYLLRVKISQAHLIRIRWEITWKL